jgi:pimeloyl-ACP methyl ester carboxylesterase
MYVRSCSVRTVRILAAGVMVVALVATGCSDNTKSATSTTTTEHGRAFRLIAPRGLRIVLREERSARRAEASTTTTTTLPAPTTTTRPANPYAVARVQQTFVDSSRSSPARGGNAATSSRTIVTTIYYPASSAPSPANPTPTPVQQSFPLIVFAHGYAIDAAAYASLLEDLASGGYVVAAPDFPGTSTAHPGGAIRSDALQQPADISFVITSMINLSGTPGPLSGVVDSAAVGDSGQSDGGVTAAAAAYNTCCIDTRIKASSILTGGAFGFDGQWFPLGTPPVMFVHATADEINPYSASTSMFATAQPPKYLFTFDGGSHLEVYVDPPWEEHVARAMVAFFDLYLKRDPAAAERLAAEGNQPGYTLQSG